MLVAILQRVKPLKSKSKKRRVRLGGSGCLKGTDQTMELNEGAYIDRLVCRTIYHGKNHLHPPSLQLNSEWD